VAKKKLPTGPGVSGAPKPNELVVPQAREQLKGLLYRLAIPVLGSWLLCGLLAAFVYSQTWKIVLISVPVLITVLAVGLIVFALRQAKKAEGVANILSGIENDADRKRAIAELETAASKKNDPSAIFAKAQLELQEDPRIALKTLERIDLGKVMGPVADEARGQRAMIHLMLGEVSEARTLVSSIELKRHQEARTRAMLASVMAESWARSGEAQRAVDTLKLFDTEDAAYEQLRPQLYRAYAYAYAHTNDLKGLRRMLKKLAAQDIRLLGGFMMKRTHPLLQKEAKKALEQSGQVPRKMIVQRR
jgi:hypothetical protein